jgi:acyl dehydratase
VTVPEPADVIGKQTSKGTIALERGPISAFALAVTDRNPIFQDERAAKEAGFDGIPLPPTYPFAMGTWGRFPELQPDDAPGPGANPMGEIIGSLMAEGGLVLHGEQAFEYHRPVVAGEVLHEEGKVVDLYTKESKGRTMTFLVTETEYRGEDGELAITARFNLIHRS